MEFIRRYVDKESLNTPIFTKDIIDYVQENDPDATYPVIVQYIKRYVDDNEQIIKRYQSKGIFYKYAKTPLGDTGIDQGKLISKLCLFDGDERIGYETGPGLINSLGLSTQMPSRSYIVTNNNRSSVIKDMGIVLVKPYEEITSKNYIYYQFIDVLGNVYNANIDVGQDEYNRIMWKYMNDNRIKCKDVLPYIKKYSNRTFIYDQLSNLMEYGNALTSR